NELIFRNLEQADCTMFVATLCSGSSYEKLYTFAKYMAWVFFDCGAVKDDPNAASLCRNINVEYFKYDRWRVTDNGESGQQLCTVLYAPFRECSAVFSAF
ncbi:hypothetical protein ASPFODRAFT_129003, partial [Aspergillus luchuensis CBS 106.47]